MSISYWINSDEILIIATFFVLLLNISNIGKSVIFSFCKKKYVYLKKLNLLLEFPNFYVYYIH